MKTGFYLKLFVISFCMAILVVACKKDKDVEPVIVIDGNPSVASLSGRSISFSGNNMSFSVDLFVVDKNGKQVKGLSKGNFAVDNKSSNYTYTLDDIKTVGQTAKAGGYAAMMLLDQSGSIFSSDPDYLRIEASKIFIKSLGQNDRAAVASFTSNYSKNIVYHQGFSRDTTAQFKTLDSLSKVAAGGTPLYYSVIEAQNYTALKATNPNKAILAFTDGDDTDYTKTIKDVIANSLAKNIPVYTIGLSNDVEEVILAQMANETGGAFFWAKDAKQLVTAFGTLGNLLEGSAELYRTTWSLKRASGNWKIGDTISGTLKITLPSGEVIDSVFFITIK